MATIKAMDLFEAYAKQKLPMDQGYIVSSFFKEDSAYSIYEIVSYATLKDIYLTGNGLTFQTNGKLFSQIGRALLPRTRISGAFTI